MSKVTFRSKKAFLQISYMDVFKVGFIEVPVVAGKPIIDGKPNIDYAKCKELGIKDPDMIGGSYTFMEGEKNNELTLEDEDVITAMREYVASRNDYLIVELDAEGNEPAEPEGVIFESKTPCFQLYPSYYKHISTAEGKTFNFNMGEKQNRYITSDAGEIKTLRDYASSALGMFNIKEVKE